MTSRKHTIVLWIVAIVIIVACEVGIFNLSHWRTVGAPAVASGTPVVGSGLTDNGDGTYTVTDAEHATLDIPIADAATGGAAELKSIRLVPAGGGWSYATASFETAWTSESFLQDPDGTAASDSAASGAAVSDTDDSTADDSTADDSTSTDDLAWRDLGEGIWTDSEKTLTYTAIPSTQYILAGQKSDMNRTSTWLRIDYCSQSSGAVVSLGSYELNPTVPLMFSLPRIAIMLAVAAFIICLRPGSMLWRRRLDVDSRGHRIALGVFIAAQSAVLLVISQMTGGSHVSLAATFSSSFAHWVDPAQYQRLGDALLHGHLWLDLPVDNSLLTMPNPYDYGARVNQNAATGAVYYWDHAYYQGHYYCYFGVLPALVLFAPFQAITGRWLATWAASWVLAVGFTVFGSLAIMSLVARYFPNASQAMAWLCLAVAMAATSMWYYIYNPSFYGVPVLMAMAVAAAGLYLWLRARRDAATGRWAFSSRLRDGAAEQDDFDNDDAGNGDAAAVAAAPATRLSALRVVLGTALMAMTVGCRPQFAALILLAIPIFWHEIRHTRQLLSRSSWRLTLAVVLAGLAVIVPLCAYNVARFGSPFDFGEDYNLTSYDLTSQRPSVFLLFEELFLELFQPVALIGRFPFVQITDMSSIPAPNEPSLGGLFALVPFLCAVAFTWMARRPLRRHHAWGLTLWSLALAVLVILVDTLIGGINNRYYGDFSMLVALAAILVALSLEEALRPKGREDDASAGCATIPARVMAVVAAASVLFAAFMISMGFFATGRYEALSTTDPVLYAWVGSWFSGLCM